MLYSTTILILFLGVYFIINTFNRFEKRPNQLTHFIVTHQKISKIFGGILMIGSFFLLLNFHGLWSAFFMWFYALILILLLTVLLNPISKIRLLYFFIFGGIMFILEIIITYAC